MILLCASLADGVERGRGGGVTDADGRIRDLLGGRDARGRAPTALEFELGDGGFFDGA